jgi:3-hydroxybutyryl-CoA dehydrogenase
MTILFTGPSGLLKEWLDVCRGHECIVYARGMKKKLDDNVRVVHALDEAPHIDLIIDLHVRFSKGRRIVLGDVLAEINPDAPLLCNTVAVTATEIVSRIGAEERMVGIAALPGLIASDVVETCYPFRARHGHQELLAEFFNGMGKRMHIVRDEVGMVTPRLLALMINEAMLVCQQDIVGIDALDDLLARAMPDAGPLTWARRIGWRNLHIVLEAMHRELGGERYRPASLLKKMAMIE